MNVFCGCNSTGIKKKKKANKIRGAPSPLFLLSGAAEAEQAGSNV